ncbi:MAG: hypothetical protein DRO99_00855 [Candidatus Aenigmatarchaeota archaeon]|nr:MAG: hypothetical protein DRO99_00855 [Candidatus Aenigmarchaeota archaeon]
MLTNLTPADKGDVMGMLIEYPMQELRKFHKMAQKKIDKLEKGINDLEKTKDIGGFEETFIEFFDFVENDLPVHIEDEEHALFPMLRICLPDENPDNTDAISAMLNDHKDVIAAAEVIRLMKRLIGGEEKNDKEYVDEIIARARSIIDVMNDHFLKEEEVIYKLAEDKLTNEQMDELSKKMEAIRECRRKNGDSVKSCKP